MNDVLAEPKKNKWGDIQLPLIEKPSWACKNYGNYEHDWMDCYECLEKYEIDLLEHANCSICGNELEYVRPGKWQCNYCEAQACGKT